MFPALCALRYCDAKIPAMDKIYYLVKRVDYALLSSQPFLTDEELFGPMNGELCDGVNDEFGTFVESLVKKNFQVMSSQGKLQIFFPSFLLFVWIIMFSIDSFN